jgi:transposase-like protein
MAMKEIILKSTTSYGNKITTSCFFFTDEERDHIFTILKKHNESYDKAKIEEFLDYTRAHIDIVRDIRRQPKSARHVEDLKNILKQFQKTRQYLIKILGAPNNFRVLRPRQCDYLIQWVKDPKQGDLIDETRRNAQGALDNIEKLLQNITYAIEIQKTNAQGGRPKADEFRFALLITRLFKRYIGIPRPHSGPFREVIEFCFEAAKIPGNDRSHAISQALKEYRKLIQPQSSETPI